MTPCDLKFDYGFRCDKCGCWRNTTQLEDSEEKFCGECAAKILNDRLWSVIGQMALCQRTIRKMAGMKNE